MSCRNRKAMLSPTVSKVFIRKSQRNHPHTKATGPQRVKATHTLGSGWQGLKSQAWLHQSRLLSSCIYKQEPQSPLSQLCGRHALTLFISPFIKLDPAFPGEVWLPVKASTHRVTFSCKASACLPFQPGLGGWDREGSILCSFPGLPFEHVPA